MGGFFFVMGIVGFVAPQQDFGVYHALLHFLTGIVALGLGTVGTARHPQIAGLGLGVLYLALGVLGYGIGRCGRGPGLEYRVVHGVHR